ncbi:uncharacterized protein GGS22DRAFT_151725 [Annulohypoxylon maeteangense]|uniref:uncharacterized protein n=1 Tax=Annulohypoxylon maeteangense TaxID=1927788 RepID=UPI0020080298|nr:uncharacterized protein GGS22DRAFT_151725 [Annulohypoxylon maeteangense]KAI0890742.1 hypothetical protein GGS22DRAFT_151725 [Annulohypoxylon maeteangense]
MQIVEPGSESNNRHVGLLILGAGWTSTFLIPLLTREGIKYAATTTDGRDGTIHFRFDPESRDSAPFKTLPSADTVLITFPLRGQGQSKHLVRMYESTHQISEQYKPNFVQLGATSIWTEPTWHDENSPYDRTNVRAIAEDELIEFSQGAVLNLAGLYGASRQPRDWVDRVIKSKAELKAKGALHVIHGEDVARAIVALHRNFTPGKRWLLSDMHVYDWWDLAQDWAIQTLQGVKSGDLKVPVDKFQRQEELLVWVSELMVEEGVRALPRDTSSVGRALDGRGFWQKMGILPTQGRIR